MLNFELCIDYNSEIVFSDKLEGKRGKFVGNSVPLLLVGNKIDLVHERQITTGQGREIAKRWQLKDSSFIEVTAKDTGQIKVRIFEL